MLLVWATSQVLGNLILCLGAQESGEVLCASASALPDYILLTSIVVLVTGYPVQMEIALSRRRVKRCDT